MVSRHVVCAFFLLCAGMTPSARAQDNHEGFWRLVEAVNDIITGRDLGRAETFIAKGAHLVYGARFESLSRVVAGEVPSCPLADSSYVGVMMQAKTNESEDAGYLVLKTVNSDESKVRFHTVVFMKDSVGQYKISSWHTGEGI